MEEPYKTHRFAPETIHGSGCKVLARATTNSVTSENALNDSSKKTTDWVHRIIMPCSEVTHLLSDPASGQLSARERIALRVHLSVCSWCSQYKRQVQRLRNVMESHSSDVEAPSSTGLSPEARERIRRSLNGEQS